MSDTNKYVFEPFCFDAATGELFNNGTPVAIPPKQAELLLLFLTSPQTLLTRETIQQSVWSDTVVEFDQSLNFAIKGLRKILDDDPKSPQFIETIPRKGYRFKVLPVVQHSKSTSPSTQRTVTARHWFLGIFIGVVAALSFSIWHTGSVVSSDHANQVLSNPQSSIAKRAKYLFDKSDQASLTKSVSLFEQHLQQYPSDGSSYALAAIALIKTFNDLQQIDNIQLYLDNSKLYAPDSAEYLLAHALYNLYIEWHVEEALRLASKAVKLAPDWVLAWHELAVIQVIMGKNSDALTSIEHLMQLAPGIALERFHAGWFYQLNGQSKIALQHYQHSLEINDQQPLTWLFAALVAGELGVQHHKENYLKGFVSLYNLPEPESKRLISAIEEEREEVVWHWWQTWLKEHKASHFFQALAAALNKDRESTITQLTLTAEDKEILFPTVLAFSQFNFLHKDPEFLSLTATIQR